MPTVAERVWLAFWKLDARRTGHGYGVNTISHSEIEAWCRLNGASLRPWEREALDQMEIERLMWLNRERSADVVVRDQPVTPDLVKALFG